MKRTYFIIIIICTIFQLPAQVHKDTNERQQETYLAVPLLKLFETPKEYQGKKIQVQGYFILAFEGTSLYLSKESRLDNTSKDGFWLDFSPEVFKKQDPNKFHEKYVTIYGSFDMNEHGHMGRYRGAIMNIVKIELKDQVKMH